MNTDDTLRLSRIFVAMSAEIFPPKIWRARRCQKSGKKRPGKIRQRESIWIVAMAAFAFSRAISKKEKKKNKTLAQ